MRKNGFYIALVVPFVLSGAANYMRWGPVIEFALSAIAILFVAGFLGKATESVAHYAGQRLGGFLNATFGNAAELIIAMFLVKEGLFDMVKASLTGAIIGNLLLVLGLSILLGGLKYKEQYYNIQIGRLQRDAHDAGGDQPVRAGDIRQGVAFLVRERSIS